ncbi:hypothetical protein [Algoriphagus aquimarinus]|uniref:hypothetical protein n=1 Tax=Algoriphagus aquimarinus TaxID=237018 RepID=UPI0030DD5931
MLTYHLEKGNIKKEVLENGMVIYHNHTHVQEFTKIHDRQIEPDPVNKVVMRPRRNRISMKGTGELDKPIAPDYCTGLIMILG